MKERRVNLRLREQFEAMRLELVRRLLPVCRQMKPSELKALTCRMTRLRIRYDTVSAVPDHWAV